MDVMDHPSSVITQVSRDEEASKAAADRGESLLLSREKLQPRLGDNKPPNLALGRPLGPPRTWGRSRVRSRAQRRTFLTLDRSANVITVEALRPGIKVADVTSESQARVSGVNVFIQL